MCVAIARVRAKAVKSEVVMEEVGVVVLVLGLAKAAARMAAVMVVARVEVTATVSRGRWG